MINVLFSAPLVMSSQVFIKPEPQIEVQRIEQKVDLGQVAPKPSQSLPQRDDDWFVLSEVCSKEAVIPPTGI